MELVNNTVLRKDNTLLAITHLSQLLHYVTGFGGFLVPLIIWLTSRKNVEGMDEHGKAILNFQISLLIWFIICIPLCLVLIGILGLVVLGIIALIFPIINAISASSGGRPYYPLSLQIIK